LESNLITDVNFRNDTDIDLNTSESNLISESDQLESNLITDVNFRNDNAEEDILLETEFTIPDINYRDSVSEQNIDNTNDAKLLEVYKLDVPSGSISPNDNTFIDKIGQVKYQYEQTNNNQTVINTTNTKFENLFSNQDSEVSIGNILQYSLI
jgi:hypothetical protein